MLRDRTVKGEDRFRHGGVQMKKKIALVVSFTVVLMFAVLITLQTVSIGQMFKRSMGNDSQTHSERIAGAYSLALANKVNEYLSLVRFYTDSDAVSTGNERAIVEWLQNHAGSRRSYFSYVMYVNQDGDFHSDIGDSGNIANSEIYDAIFKKGRNDYVTDPQTDSITGKLVIHVGRAAKVQGKVIGFFVAVVPVQNFQYMIDYIRVGENGRAWIVTDQGLVLAHHNSDYAMKLNLLASSNVLSSKPALKKMAEKLVAGGIGVDWTESLEDDSDSFVSYSPIPNTKWSLVISIPKSQVYAGHDAVVPYMLTLNVLICLFVLVMTVVIVTKIMKPLTKVNDSITDIASGSADLTSRIEITAKNEIGSVVEGFNAFTAKLQNIVKEIKTSDVELYDAGKELDGCSKNTSEAISEILSQINNMNSCIDMQSNGVGATVNSVNEIARSISDFERLIENQSAGVAQASTAVEEMMGNINSVNSSVEKMAAQFQGLEHLAVDGSSKQSDVNEKISLIENESQMLQEANSAIAAIAEQTNLLAMNAAIEAAHAGEAGKGFSVVADEIRKLSETSSEQSKTIGNQLQKIQESIKSVVSASEASSAVFGSMVDGIKSTDNLVQEIRNAMLEQTEGSKQINEALKDMNESTSDVRSASKDVASSNQAILDQIRGLENSTDVMKNSMIDMKNGANKISSTGQELSSITGRMKSSIDGIGSQISQFKV